MKRMNWLVPAITMGVVCWGSSLAAQENEAEGSQADVAKAITGVPVSLERGLAASATQGQPISGKFEIEDGHLQLSVYTLKAGKYFEVIVDYKTGKLVKTEAITAAEDSSAATEQYTAMAKAKVPLRTAVATALRQNQGAKAISVVPSLKDGHPVADVTLVENGQIKSVSVPL